MNREMRFVITASKLYLEDSDCGVLEKCINDGLFYDKILYYCVHNRVVPIVWKNMKKLDLARKFESTVKRAFDSICECVKNKNEYEYIEIENINNTFLRSGIKAVMLKGAVLAPTLYNDISLREFGDIDFLVHNKDIAEVERILKQLGYIQGKYIKREKRIQPATRVEIIQKKKYTHELVEFIKVDSFCEDIVHMVDINHAIFWKGKTGKFQFNTDELMNNVEKVKILNSFCYSLIDEYQLIQLCAHLYSEAVFFLWDTEWERNKSEICLYRFCDIYELLNKKSIDWNKLYDIVRRNNIEEPINYCFRCINHIFGNVVGNSWFGKFDNSDKINVVDKYFDKNDCEKLWRLDIYDRLFETNKKIV